MELRPVYENELYHHGIAGMRWGRRNGPPYPLSAGAHSPEEKKAGKKGWAKKASETPEERKQRKRERVNRAFDQTIKVGKDKAPISPAEAIARNSRDALNSVGSLRNNLKKFQPDNRQETVKNMSDEELQKRIKRLDMERRYMSLTEDEVNTGKDYFDKFVDIGNDVVTLALAVGGTIAMIHKIKKV